jgi:hypothetical protein
MIKLKALSKKNHENRGRTMHTKLITLFSVLFLISTTALADTTYQPFILASVNDSELAEQTEATISALQKGGFTLAGQYSPLDNAIVLVVTSPNLKSIAALSDKGGYGAGQRVSITEREGKTEVAYINPLYIQHAYRLEGDMQSVLDQLSAVLGNVETFGADKEMTAKKLGKYHYKPMMPYFDDPMELGTFDSHEAAITAVESGLAKEGDPLTLVYRIDIPGKNQTVFGVGMKATTDADEEVDIDESHQLSIVDFEGYSKVAYFPYEILVDEAAVEALPMKFRMAVHFPDLPMMGKHGFTKLMSSPGATEDALEELVKSGN